MPISTPLALVRRPVRAGGSVEAGTILILVSEPDIFRIDISSGSR
jgi:hypothetical protein